MENNNNRKYLAILIILLGLIFLALIVYFLFFFKGFVPAPQPVATTTAAAPKELPPAGPVVRQLEIKKDDKAVPADPKEIGKFNLEKMASSFAERLGSYSNQSNYSNIVDLKLFMTASMQKWADDYVAKMRSETAYSGVYEGMVTKAISSDPQKYDEAAGQAQFLVHTQKVVSKGDQANVSTYYEDILIDLVKVGNDWKVDNAKWQGKK